MLKVKTKGMVHLYILPLFDWYQVEILAEPFRRSDHSDIQGEKNCHKVFHDL